MGRDVGRDEGREQAEWRDLVARLELQAPIDPAQAPWPDRENLRAKAQPGTSAGSSTTPEGTTPEGTAGEDTAQQAAEVAAAGAPAPDEGPDGLGGPEGTGRLDGTSRPDGLGDPDPEVTGQPDATGQLDAARLEDIGLEDTGLEDTGLEDADPANDAPDQRGLTGRSRVIRPAGSTRLPGPAGEPSADASPTTSSSAEPAAGPRDYGLDEPRDDDLDELWDDRYVPPPLPPGPSLDPVAKGAWLALFGGPGYLLVATLLNWQIPGWAALASVIGFVTGFIVLVFRLGDGPSKRDGPDQGAVV